MSFYGRHGVLDGAQVKLRVVFVDDADVFVDASALPTLYIYDESVDADTMNGEIEAAVYTSAFAGPLTPTRIDTGFYEYIYTVPTGSAAGLWHDVWVATINSTPVVEAMSFTVVNGADIETQSLSFNQLVVIELDQSISSYTGESLAADTQLSFLTVLKPYYSSPELVRMEIGPWIDFIPDATLALMIHWSSKEADFIKAGCTSTADRLKFARAKFVAYDAVLRALYLPGSLNFQSGSGGPGDSKRLGDLAITKSAAAMVARTASGIDIETLKYMRKRRDEWWKVVNSGATLMPGQSYELAAGTRGRFDVDRRNSGRLWVDPDCEYYEQPGTNAKANFGGRRNKFYWRPTWPSESS